MKVRKVKQDGFSLAELLVMITVLGILMAVTIPNISGILENHRLNTFEMDASNMVEIAKVQVAKNSSIDKPRVGQCLIFPLDYLNTNDEFGEGPNGGIYNLYDSFVLYTRVRTSDNTTKFKYYVRLVESVKENNYGIDLIDIDEVTNLKKEDINKLPLYGLSENKDSSISLLQTELAKYSTLSCTNIEYYLRKK